MTLKNFHKLNLFGLLACALLLASARPFLRMMAKMENLNKRLLT